MPLALVNADGLAAQGCGCRVFARQSPAMPRGCTLRASATWRGSRQALWLHGRAPVLRRAATRLHAVNKIDKLNTEELEVAIQERNKPLIVDFFATWCGPCVLLAKELEQVAAELGDEVRIVKVDVDEEQGLASHLQIQGLPTLVFIGMDKEKPALRLEGLLPASAIKDVLVDLTAPKVGA